MKTLARAYLGYSILWAVLFAAWIPYAIFAVRRVIGVQEADVAVPAVVQWLPLGCAFLFVVLVFVSQCAYFFYVSRCFRARMPGPHCRALCLIGALSVPIGTILAVFALRVLAKEDA
jgi:hypothetical protein